ncbi:MAG TPA: hypothetical protein VGF67_00475 [Ktedonobacteraceae bacterium]|jgi:hypothetical protein
MAADAQVANPEALCQIRGNQHEALGDANLRSPLIVFTMLVTGAYTLAAAIEAWTITIAQLITTHGLMNALLFDCGALARGRGDNVCAYR